MANSSINYAVKLLLILVISQLDVTQAELVAMEASTSTGEFRPVGPTEYKVVEGRADEGGGRRRLAPFQLCLLCKCCSTTTCATMPCCFGIDCELPNKPFGVCAFVPKTCNCTSCAV